MLLPQTRYHWFIHTCFPIRGSGALQQTFYGSLQRCPVLCDPPSDKSRPEGLGSISTYSKQGLIGTTLLPDPSRPVCHRNATCCLLSATKTACTITWGVRDSWRRSGSGRSRVLARSTKNPREPCCTSKPTRMSGSRALTASTKASSRAFSLSNASICSQISLGVFPKIKQAHV